MFAACSLSGWVNSRCGWNNWSVRIWDSRGQVRAGEQSYATLAQRNEAVNELQPPDRGRCGTAKAETLEHVDKWKTRPPNQCGDRIRGQGWQWTCGGFSEEYPKEGVKNRTRCKRVTPWLRLRRRLALGSSSIINANKLTDPLLLWPGPNPFHTRRKITHVSSLPSRLGWRSGRPNRCS
jgi:hypothetical protein